MPDLWDTTTNGRGFLAVCVPHWHHRVNPIPLPLLSLAVAPAESFTCSKYFVTSLVRGGKWKPVLGVVSVITMAAQNLRQRGGK